MAGKPIIFSTPMVRALLAGNKTQTRRIIKNVRNDNCIQLRKATATKAGIVTHAIDAPKYPHLMPIRATIGDRLWVREAWSFGAEGCWTIGQMQMARGHTKIDLFYRADPVKEQGLADGWLPSIHMPRWVSRLTLTVTDVRVQRLQDISEADAWAEGCKPGTIDDRGNPFPAEEPSADGKCMIGWDCARDWYADLWEALHGPTAWDANPWVAAYSFTVEKMNIDNRAAP